MTHHQRESTQGKSGLETQGLPRVLRPALIHQCRSNTHLSRQASTMPHRNEVYRWFQGILREDEQRGLHDFQEWRLDEGRSHRQIS